MSVKVKLLFQVLIALGASVAIFVFSSSRDNVTNFFVPFLNKAVFDMMWYWIIFATIYIAAITNAVNFTDGLDGLATGSVLIVAASLGIMTYLTGHIKIADYLRIPYIPESAELTVFIAAVIGASIGFLWFNSNPASVFMGDTGSLALGGVIGIIALMIKKEVFLLVVGGVWVLEIFSVIIQVIYFKLTKKRVFKMAPWHHHFELLGWSEQKVVVRMWILGVMFAILGLIITLKIQ
jgi:phospho-N-acetylmuramoyl-pentapeptide-transferase